MLLGMVLKLLPKLTPPEVLIGGLIGSIMIFYFTGLAISAAGKTAHEVVIEV